MHGASADACCDASRHATPANYNSVANGENIVLVKIVPDPSFNLNFVVFIESLAGPTIWTIRIWIRQRRPRPLDSRPPVVHWLRAKCNAVMGIWARARKWARPRIVIRQRERRIRRTPVAPVPVPVPPTGPLWPLRIIRPTVMYTRITPLTPHRAPLWPLGARTSIGTPLRSFPRPSIFRVSFVLSFNAGQRHSFSNHTTVRNFKFSSVSLIFENIDFHNCSTNSFDTKRKTTSYPIIFSTKSSFFPSSYRYSFIIPRITRVIVEWNFWIGSYTDKKLLQTVIEYL